MLREAQAAFSRLDKAIFVRALDALHLITARSENFDRIYSNDRHVLAGEWLAPDVLAVPWWRVC
jgi:hypothetical protein